LINKPNAGGCASLGNNSIPFWSALISARGIYAASPFNPKTEVRIREIRKKPEIRTALGGRSEKCDAVPQRICSFGLRISFGFWISNFGFRVQSNGGVEAG
jgi:hypothetical protein